MTLSASRWAVKNGMNYTINIPVKAPQIIVGGKEKDIKPPASGEIRAQVFFPRAVEVKSVIQTPQQRPYKKLFQFNHEVLTWFTDNLQIDDTIKIEGSFSEVLSKIVETNEKTSSISDSIKKAKGQGIDVSDAEAHIKNAEEYLNTAIGSFWKGESENAMTYIGYANDELKQAEGGLAAPARTSEPTQTPASGTKKNPGFEWIAGIIAFGLMFALMRKK